MGKILKKAAIYHLKLQQGISDIRLVLFARIRSAGFWYEFIHYASSRERHLGRWKDFNEEKQQHFKVQCGRPKQTPHFSSPLNSQIFKCQLLLNWDLLKTTDASWPIDLSNKCGSPPANKKPRNTWHAGSCIPSIVNGFQGLISISINDHRDSYMMQILLRYECM